MYSTLNKLQTGEVGLIADINKNCNSKLRLMDLGFTADSEIIPIWQGSRRKITAYLIKGTLIALRNNDAGYINVHIK